jgi:predicted short-subunit dehydrogenase-like oxidoreductase (DUF2520 family)
VVTHVRTAICYRADGSRKWATFLPDGAALPPTTIEDGETLWPDVIIGHEKDGRVFAVPFKGPVKGPATGDA